MLHSSTWPPRLVGWGCDPQPLAFPEGTPRQSALVMVESPFILSVPSGQVSSLQKS